MGIISKTKQSIANYINIDNLRSKLKIKNFISKLFWDSYKKPSFRIFKMTFGGIII
jgi:hypothetical protein